MIKKVILVAQGDSKPCEWNDFISFEQLHKGNQIQEFTIQFKKEQILEKLYLDITLDSIPSYWRGSDYRWKPISTKYLTANYHSPKVLKFSNENFLAALQTTGCWEWIHAKNILRWHLIHPSLAPTSVYTNADKRLSINSQTVFFGTFYKLGLFFGEGKVPEFARSPKGFIPTVCFTDHCDFDTQVLLEAQRKFFNKAGIKTTKGFFLNTFSHKGDFAAYDQPTGKAEFQAWQADGHELAYHGLSRSFRDESWNEFENFATPDGLNQVTTYIDHGYLEYNLSKQKPENFDSWCLHMYSKGIKFIWNYMDVIEGNADSNNQMSILDFSISKISGATSFHNDQKLPNNKSRNFKTWLAYGTTEALDKEVKFFRNQLDIRNKSLKNHVLLLKSFIKVLAKSSNPIIWKRNILERDKPFYFAEFSPIFFKAINQSQTDLLAFQTISVKDIESVFSALSLQKLKKEYGILIAHTYFAYLGPNHPQRMFLDERGSLNPRSEQSFILLGNEIKANKIWNPTLKEMADFHVRLFALEFEWDGEKLVPNDQLIPTRYLN